MNAEIVNKHVVLYFKNQISFEGRVISYANNSMVLLTKNNDKLYILNVKEDIMIIKVLAKDVSVVPYVESATITSPLPQEEYTITNGTNHKDRLHNAVKAYAKNQYKLKNQLNHTFYEQNNSK